MSSDNYAQEVADAIASARKAQAEAKNPPADKPAARKAQPTK